MNTISREIKIYLLTLQKELAFTLSCTVYLPFPGPPAEFMGVRDAQMHTKYWSMWSQSGLDGPEYSCGEASFAPDLFRGGCPPAREQLPEHLENSLSKIQQPKTPASKTLSHGATKGEPPKKLGMK